MAEREGGVPRGSSRTLGDPPWGLSLCHNVQWEFELEPPLMVGLALATPGEPSQLWDHPRAQMLHLQQERPRSFGTTIHQRNALRRQAGVKYSPLLVKYSPLLVKYWPAVCPPAGGELEEGWELEKESRETWKSHKMICLRKLKRKHKKECIADRDSITGRKYQTLDTEVPDPAF